MSNLTAIFTFHDQTVQTVNNEVIKSIRIRVILCTWLCPLTFLFTENYSENVSKISVMLTVWLPASSAYAYRYRQRRGTSVFSPVDSPAPVDVLDIDIEDCELTH